MSYFWHFCHLTSELKLSFKTISKGSKKKKIFTRMLRLIAVQMVSIIPLVHFHPAEAFALSGVNNPGPSLTSAARLTSLGWIITQTAFYLLSFRIWIGSGFRSAWLCHRPSRQLRSLILQHIQCLSPLVDCTAPGLSHHLIVTFDYTFSYLSAVAWSHLA